MTRVDNNKKIKPIEKSLTRKRYKEREKVMLERE